MTAPRWTLGVQDRARLPEPAKESVLGSKSKGTELSEVVKGRGNGRSRLRKEDPAPTTTLLDQLIAQQSFEKGKGLDPLDDQVLKMLLKKKQAALLEAERRAGVGHSFDPNAPRGGAERGGGYFSSLELLLREAREKEKEGKLGGGGKGSSAEKNEKLDSKVLLKELLQYRESYMELEQRYESAVLEIEHLHQMLKVAEAAEQLAPSRYDLTYGPLADYERKNRQLEAQYAADRERFARQQHLYTYQPPLSYPNNKRGARFLPSRRVHFEA